MKAGNIITPGAALVLIAGIFGLSATAADGAAIKCAYTQAGPAGLAGNRLDIRVNRQEESTAVYAMPGGRIRVTDDQRMRDLRCKGRKPTVTNIDRISYKATKSAETTNFTVVSPRDFVPGTRSYDDGGSGIGIRVSGKAVSFGTVGTEGVDEVTAGTVDGLVGIDYGPEPANQDVEVRIKADFTNLINVLKGGDDAFTGAGSGLFDSPTRSSATVYGESGKDFLVGGAGPDILDGGSGPDTLYGFRGPDILTGGPGVDELDGMGGNDEIDAIDGRRESVECGKGKDLAAIDLSDEDSNCESFSYP